MDQKEEGTGYNEETDVFKTEFKRYRRPCQDDLKNVINFDSPDLYDEVIQVDFSDKEHTSAEDILGLVPCNTWRVFRLKSKPGLLVIRNPFLPGYQHQWIVQCLVEYPLLPNVCNLDSHMTRCDKGRLWPAKDKSIFKDFISFKDSLLYKLRWVTLGYHYNWTTKLYDPNNHSPFPGDLGHLSKHILSVVGFKDFKAEAAIVNYYHMDSTLSGHTDHSERDLDAPLISFSFGQSAIFLIGGCTKQEKPVPLFLHSGDIVVMSEESRLAYHAVPRVVEEPNGGITSCLSEEAFRRAMEGKHYSSEKVCSLCGKILVESLQSTEMDLEVNYSEKQTQEKLIVDDKNRKRPRTDESQTLSPKNKVSTVEVQENCHSVEENKVEGVRDCTGVLEDLSDCENCLWILHNWDDFKFYISFSRININIRQVGTLKHIA